MTLEELFDPDAGSDTARYVGAPTEEQMRIAVDLTQHTANKFMTAVQEFVELADHPAQVYMMLMKSTALLAMGFAVFQPVTGIDSHGKVPRLDSTQRLDRIRYSMGVVFLTAAHASDYQPAAALLKRLSREDMPSDTLWRLISEMDFKCLQ